ncbi:hypothetical protein ACSZN8_15690 [Aeromonas caviae]
MSELVFPQGTFASGLLGEAGLADVIILSAAQRTSREAAHV